MLNNGICKLEYLVAIELLSICFICTLTRRLLGNRTIDGWSFLASLPPSLHPSPPPSLSPCLALCELVLFVVDRFVFSLFILK